VWFGKQNAPRPAFPPQQKVERPMIPTPSDEPWRTCYRELAPKLLLFARQWVTSLADAEDVVQTAFVKFWRRQPDAGPEHYPLLYSAVRSTALDQLRGDGRRARREADPAVEVLREDQPYFDPGIEQRESAAIVEEAMRRLPTEQREVLALRIWGELTFAEIAETLGESINTVASRHRYALDALRRHLKSYEPERIRA
jgi:RNA polymerase sigma-70 factor (ECF subfamily)